MIDWNLLGVPRPRPNKWLAEASEVLPGGEPGDEVVQQWREWSYARRAHGQSYYMEQWCAPPQHIA